MRRIYKIAKAELFTLFYSPIAWFILVVFAFQTALTFTELMQEATRAKTMGYGQGFLTATIFGGTRGLFTVVQNYLYLYIPLLTMGLMSREYSSGTIKLLYSSPVSARHVIAGKFAAMAGYGLVLAGVLLVHVLFAGSTIEAFDWPAALAGLLGLYLLICAYSAIGLFVSSLTSYQVVAAIGTLVLLAALNYVGRVGQEIELVREITWWLSISGRCNEFVSGLICSEDALYFVIVAAMFLLLAALKLQRQRRRDAFLVTCGKHAAVLLGAMLLGYITSRPALMFYHDATDTKRLTLTPKSQEIMARLDGGMTITTFVNLLDREYYHGMPASVMNDMERFRQYRRFKPEIKMKYVYYYDTVTNHPWLERRFPGMTVEEMARELAKMREYKLAMFKTPAGIRQIIDLSDEGNTFVRLIERENGQRAFLRIYNDMMKFPSEAEVTAAFKRMVMKLPRVGFLAGHGERRADGDRARDYTVIASRKDFRYALTNQGCDIAILDLSGENAIPPDIDIIVIADPREPLPAQERAKLDDYIARGGNLIIAVEPKSPESRALARRFGEETLPGTLVQPKVDVPPDYVLARATPAAGEQSDHYREMLLRRQFRVGFTGATGLQFTGTSGFTMTPLLTTDTMTTWNEVETIDLVNDTARLNPAAGETAGPFTLAMALSRRVGEKEQRVMVLGDADFISNGGMTPPRGVYQVSNFTMISGMFDWLSYGTVPVDTRRPPSRDNTLSLVNASVPYMKVGLLGMFPALLLAWGTLLIARRKGK
jgi:ABC-2 type transport system permease protein